MFTLLQVSVLCCLVVFLSQCSAYYHRRNRQDWVALTGQLRPDTGELAQFRNARVMMEMCDYAERHGSVSLGELAAIRKDAMQVRVSVVTAWAGRKSGV